MRPAARDVAMGGGAGGLAGAAASTSSVVPPVQAPPFWSTPTPYLFIGFGVVMALIAVALAVLLFSRRKEGGGGGGGGRHGDEETVPPGMMSVRVLAPLDREAPPRVVVVMAGDDLPSFIASATPPAFAAAGLAINKMPPQP
ncbi:hypothetical protein GUJ93_ZPchr0006g44317 [Zizania palustris]|uniref:Uncharacterized protein n=1 Tax=Zizania palustris TaxID=103762 RepID=A0A8J5SV76_ZIZPA|nr:hypothetical protein GUJ93_ZPchr0006g44317 [Zizania palustris]